MSLKSVEMQIAVPRTQEAGRVQNELYQRPTQDQALLADQLKKEAAENQKRSTSVDESANTAIRDDNKKNASGQSDQSGDQSQTESDAAVKEPAPAEHPYKGKHIDFSL